ncbi:hypothetical protein PLICRDRAFT_119077 [Plicaturopsis crispa FD-325 SS-3]|uniref:MYND-type domain-containing protein n=1 Tax=Plicaturopsis crispa FD-325 SS-3 TaxID=944288 RepID=A0A0C9SQH2_PLICR|nr:hypothetical protein PLICRDRAFT_119077 [Plicaturopsis crispa FD-325 SS-3]
MQDIIDRRSSGYIGIAQGGERLRQLYQDESYHFDITHLSEFACACYFGLPDKVAEMVGKGIAPDLAGTESAFKFGYATLTVAGAQRVEPMGGATSDHAGVLKYLLAHGALPDTEDIVGLTALHHATMNHNSQLALSRVLLAGGADPNHRNIYGDPPLLGTFMTDQAGAADLLLEHGADYDLPDADGTTARALARNCGPRMSATLSRWIARRNGQPAQPMADKACDRCGKKQDDSPSAARVKLSVCSRCKARYYCSTACQRALWSSHKKVCQPFSADNVIALRPFYRQGGQSVSTSDFVRGAMGIPTAGPSTPHSDSSRAPRKPSSKPLVIKVQVPQPLPRMSAASVAAGDLLVYTEKRDFMCSVRRADGAAAYDRVADAVRFRSVSGAKAYFAAELESKDKLVVKVSELLADQPW